MKARGWTLEELEQTKRSISTQNVALNLARFDNKKLWTFLAARPRYAAGFRQGEFEGIGFHEKCQPV